MQTLCLFVLWFKLCQLLVISGSDCLTPNGVVYDPMKRHGMVLVPFLTTNEPMKEENMFRVNINCTRGAFNNNNNNNNNNN